MWILFPLICRVTIYLHFKERFSQCHWSQDTLYLYRCLTFTVACRVNYVDCFFMSCFYLAIQPIQSTYCGQGHLTGTMFIIAKVPIPQSIRFLGERLKKKHMNNVFKRSSYPLSWTRNFQMPQMWGKDQYGGKDITFFLILSPSTFKTVSFEFLVENEKRCIFFRSYNFETKSRWKQIVVLFSPKYSHPKFMFEATMFWLNSI